ncbi:MAG: DNA polymerase I [Candidatus Eisenbacteria sp.]|nr:DNA polymerase I [Candidatus Eisenbacteria bacterium]
MTGKRGKKKPPGAGEEVSGEQSAERLFLIDGSGLLYRAYYAFLRRPLTTSRGQDVGAVFGFLNTLLALIREENACHLVVTFDAKGPTFRHERYKAYKANRPPMPPALASQIPLVHRLVDAMGLTMMMREGVEADDLIGSMTGVGIEAGWEVVIVSADKDFAQLIGPRVRQLVPARGREPPRWLGAQAIEEQWGVRPEQFVDFLALTGDASDNIPGVRGIGPKTAAGLLQTYGSLERIYNQLESVTPSGTRQKLEAGQENAHLSLELVRLRTDLCESRLANLSVPDPSSRAQLKDFLSEMEFRQVKARLFTESAAGVADAGVQGSLLERPGQASAARRSQDAGAAAAQVDPMRGSQIQVADSWGQHYQRIESPAALEKILRAFPHGGKDGPALGIDTETSSLDPLRSELVGLSFAWEPGRAWYIPLGHHEGPNLPIEGVRRRFGPLLSDAAITKAGQNLKFDLHVLHKHGFPVGGALRDTMVASYLGNPDARHGLDALALEFLGHRMVPIEALIGRGKDQISMAEVSPEHVAPYACEDVDAVVRLLPELEGRLRELEAWDLFQDVEMPLLPILAGMERTGIALNTALLEAMGESLASELVRKESEIHRLAGGDFNINSPKQLQRILFEHLKLKPKRRTKTGYSTSQEVLEELATEHPLPGQILDYRQLTKLQSTYVETLPKLVNPATGRIHATFHQTVTATGRLSSSNPNLQNIPIRSALGREIRKAFEAAPGRTLLAADYSQIELRILAHLSEDEYLISAFKEGADIHRATAARVFGVKEEMVDPAMRARAKVVNFGVLYGMGAQRLAREQGIAAKEASRFITEYFTRLPGVKRFIDRCVSEASSRGYAKTLMGRRRYLPDLQSGGHQARAAAQRMAVNTPVQGSAADLIKLAMVRLHEQLERSHPDVRLLIQVHDELIFEIPDREVEAVRELVVAEMTQVVSLQVPLRVGTGWGKNWYEAHA